MSVRPQTDAALLSVQGLIVDYPVGRKGRRRAVDDVSFEIATGATLGLVGESGSGKSSIARALVGLAPASAGQVLMDGAPITGPGPGRRRDPRQDIQMVFQDPYSSLDPTKTIGYSVAEPLLARREAALSRRDVERQVGQMLERVGLPSSAARRYPAQYSGGQRQRVAIARALIVRPRLVICDEALSALDLSVQAQILNLLAEFQADHQVSYLFISHDMSVVEFLCDQVVVLYRGRIAEVGPTGAVHGCPRHPYTRGLVASVPEMDPQRREASRQRREQFRLPVRPAEPLGDRCSYTHRCVFAAPVCSEGRPALEATPGGARVACRRWETVAAAVDEPAAEVADIETGGVL